MSLLKDMNPLNWSLWSDIGNAARSQVGLPRLKDKPMTKQEQEELKRESQPTKNFVDGAAAVVGGFDETFKMIIWLFVGIAVISVINLLKD